jgi:pimeloyl-ACP methyl ester carboxylesterase
MVHLGEAVLATRIDGAPGRPVVFVSGLGEDMRGWDEVASALARCARVVRYDRPGIGASRPAPDAAVLAQDVARQLNALLARLNVAEPVILVAHSLGGLYAQAFARLYPARTAGIVLVDASSPLEPEGVFVSTQPAAPGTTAAWEEAGIAASVAALNSGPRLPDVPLIVLVATDHQDTPQREALWLDVQRQTAALSAQGELRLADGSGHFIQEDQPSVVVAAIEAVLAATGSDTAGCSGAVAGGVDGSSAESVTLSEPGD